MARDVADELFGNEPEKGVASNKQMDRLMSAVDGMVQGTKDGVSPPGWSLDQMIRDIGQMMHQKGVQGLAELGSALYMGQSNAYVPYGQGQWAGRGEKASGDTVKEEPEHGLGNQGLEQEKSKGRSL